MVMGGEGRGHRTRSPKATVNKLAWQEETAQSLGKADEGDRHRENPPTSFWNMVAGGGAEVSQSSLKKNGLAGKLDSLGGHGIMGWEI